MLKRQVAVSTGTGEVKVIEENVPDLKDGEVLIKVQNSLISPGTEMGSIKKMRLNPESDKEDSPFGYANAGTIMEIRGDGKGLEIGMRVFAMGAGAALHATYACVPVNLVVPIPDDLPFEKAVYTCLGATSLQAIRRTEPRLGEYGIILGLGIVGNLAAQLSKLSGVRVIAWEGYESRVEIAKQCGIASFANFTKECVVDATKEFCAPYGADYAIFAFGGNATKAFEDVKKCMKESADRHIMGRTVLVGGCELTLTGGAGCGNLDVRSAARTGPGYHDSDYEHGKDYPNAFVQFTTRRNLREIVRLISEECIVVEPMTTHRMKLSDMPEAAEMLIETPEKALGVVLEME